MGRYLNENIEMCVGSYSYLTGRRKKVFTKSKTLRIIDAIRGRLLLFHKCFYSRDARYFKRLHPLSLTYDDVHLERRYNACFPHYITNSFWNNIVTIAGKIFFILLFFIIMLEIIQMRSNVANILSIGWF